MFAVAGRIGMTVAELQMRMSCRELLEWQAFMQLENGNEVVSLTAAVRDSLLPT